THGFITGFIHPHRTRYFHHGCPRTWAGGLHGNRRNSFHVARHRHDLDTTEFNSARGAHTNIAITQSHTRGTNSGTNGATELRSLPVTGGDNSPRDVIDTLFWHSCLRPHYLPAQARNPTYPKSFFGHFGGVRGMHVDIGFCFGRA